MKARNECATDITHTLTNESNHLIMCYLLYLESDRGNSSVVLAACQYQEKAIIFILAHNFIIQKLWLLLNPEIGELHTVL